MFLLNSIYLEVDSVLSMDDFQNAIAKIKSSVALPDLERYEKWIQEFDQDI